MSSQSHHDTQTEELMAACSSDLGRRPLYSAASVGHTDIVKLLLQHQYYRDHVNKCINGQTPLAVAAENGHNHVAEQLIAAGADLNKFDTIGMTPLGKAAIQGHIEIIYILLKYGTRLLINGCDLHGNTALAYAAQTQTNNSHIMRLLLYVGADVNKFEKQGKTPLMWAAGFGPIENVKVLAENGADINIRGSKGKTAVDYAIMGTKDNDHIMTYFKNKFVDEKGRQTLSDCIKANNLEMAKILIATEGNVDKAESSGETPLVCAVKTGKVEMIQLLLNNGAQFSIPSAILAAIKKNNVEIVHLLIKRGVDVNLQYRNGNTPLLQAIEMENLEIVKLLIKNGADINMPAKNGNLPLIKTVETQKWEIAEFLILHGADGNLPDKNGNLPLTKILEKQKWEIAEILILHGTDVANHPLLLIKYIQEKKINMVKLLTEKGVNLDFVSDCGFTPLTKCVEMNSYQLLDLLVQKGANVNKTDNNKHTPLSLAALNANLKMFDYLLKAGADIDQVKEKLDEVAKNSEDFAVYLNLLQKQKSEKGHKKIAVTILSSGVGSSQEEAP